MEQISGYLERITYYNEENGFMVARLQEKGRRELTTVVGNLASVNPGESLRLWGKWVNNSKYGRQFQVEKYETTVPATVNGIKKYLGSGLIKGIGPVMAGRIVRVFGLKTLEIIEESPEKLARVEGIGDKRIAMITKAWEEQKEIRDIMLFLQGHGISAGYAAKIFKRYGNNSIDIVTQNPYRLAADIYGIGFITADNIARNLGFDLQSPLRVAEGIIYVLSQLTGEGHVYYPYEQLLEKAAEMLRVAGDAVEQALAGLQESRRLVVEEVNGGRSVYLAPFYTAETSVARRLHQLNATPLATRAIDPEKAIAWVEQKLRAKLAEKQREAVTLAAHSKVLIITGGPGTGKTTITRAIMHIFAALDLKILLAAPTGRAAKRMQEATGWESRTIHRLLEYSPGGGGFQRNRDNPLGADVIIIDEASMIDIILMHHLLSAVPEQAALVLVGDVNQLPSVGPGNVLKDIIETARFPVVTLTEIFRQAKHSKIVTGAHRINQGQLPNLNNPPRGELTDFYFIPKDDPDQALDIILHLCHTHIPRRFGLHPVRDIQVLTPMHRGALGVANLNDRLQELLNPGKDAITRGYKTFKVRDKVMQIANNYQKEVYNGDLGTVLQIDREEQQITVDFEGRPVVYEFSELDELVTAYAVSIHKSQGSEYPAVVIPLTMQHYMLLQRNLIYTGITRGKKLVILVGSKKALIIAVKNNKTLHRYTGLKERLLLI